MKDITMLNKPPLDFFGCNFCLVEKHRMAFVLISKCGLTFLENIAIYASAGMIPDTEDQTHFYIARVKPERFLVPVSEMSGYEREHKSYLKVAVWRDPVERLISAYKYFILERTFNQYMYMCNLYQDCSFERFLSFVEFELGKANPLWQDEHIRRQSDFYTSAEVDCIVPLSKLNCFLEEKGVDIPEERSNATSVQFELRDEKQIARIKELYRLDYEIPVSY